MIGKKKASILIGVLVVVAVAAMIILFSRQAAGQQAPTAATAQASEPRPQPALLGQPMPDFTLPAYQGGSLTLSSLRGKNVLIIFSRGYAAPDYWCTICNYRYVELVNIEKARKIRQKYNLEVLFVFPYDNAVVKTWLEALPGQMEKIRTTKNPADPAKLDDQARARMERWRQLFPGDYTVSKDDIPTPFPVLVDADRALSKKLDLFRTEWTGSKVDQNVPAVYLVDANGVLQFKYLGQNTADRPSYDYLFKAIEAFTGTR